jgi:hypothetical protein
MAGEFHFSSGRTIKQRAEMLVQRIAWTQSAADCVQRIAWMLNHAWSSTPCFTTTQFLESNHLQNNLISQSDQVKIQRLRFAQA